MKKLYSKWDKIDALETSQKRVVKEVKEKSPIQLLHEKAQQLQVKQPKWFTLFADSHGVVVEVSFMGQVLSCSAPNKEVAKNKLANHFLAEKEWQVKIH